MNSIYWIGFDGGCKHSGCVLVHRGKILKAELVFKSRLNDWCNQIRQELGKEARIIARIEMPTSTTSFSQLQYAETSQKKFSLARDGGRVAMVAELMVEICERPHLNFEVQIVKSDDRIRIDPPALRDVNTGTQFVLGLERMRSGRKGNSKVSTSYPSKMPRFLASFIWDLSAVKKYDKEIGDALGLTYPECVMSPYAISRR